MGKVGKNRNCRSRVKATDFTPAALRLLPIGSEQTNQTLLLLPIRMFPGLLSRCQTTSGAFKTEEMVVVWPIRLFHGLDLEITEI